ncbi:hypothetical protein ACL1HT_05055 [Corynebacterium striatum]|uniref:hypothetical protein n=1 Tax=Corynebacterium striatum TaxID=43770 RepID=UPI000673D075|nr:hypothetical protein [Corynebacterium striatum]MDK8825784.1 hypothetical protein [Corynebacterium striatum]CQD12881.1 conserved hypothetical protein [Corynebacterium striatum]VFB07615.1 fimbrial associated sortase [Corynebacterium striatum]
MISSGWNKVLPVAEVSDPSASGSIARLRIPAINVDLPVRHTTSLSVLYDGAGHMFGSSLPVGVAGLGSRRLPMVV